MGKSKPIAEVIGDASTEGDDELPVPEKQGLFVMRRFNCLEMIEPDSNALVAGDANLSFSLQLAMHRTALHHPGRTIATTFEKLDTLRERYPEIDDTVKKLQENGATVFHDVDAT